jgi:glycosyltransferase involved in cell wall biosynthesis
VAAGRGRVVRELLRALSDRDDPHTYRCYARSRWDEPLDDRFSWKLLPAPDPMWHAGTAALAGRECQAFLSTNSYLTVPLLRRPAVAVVYDLVTFERGMAANRRSMIIERLTLGLAVRRAAGLICISHATSDALVARFPEAAGKCTVAALGVSPTLSAPSARELDGLPPPGFVLAVGTLEPRKNLPRLVEAYAALPRPLQESHPLVVVGSAGWQTGPTLNALRSLGERCRPMGRVSDEALAELYRRCAVFCYPSLGEGFGLPVLEAMAAGAAVVTSNASSLPEVGGDAVEYVDPHEPRDIARALGELLDDADLRSRLGQRALERAAGFSWASFADHVLRALAHAADTE